MMNSNVVLVNEHDDEVGLMPKLEAHEKGLLHRAFSVFVFNTDGNLLLQKRADSKYHSAGLWSNTCCSHPYPGEDAVEGATRRLQEEMGLTAKLRFVYSFIYKAELQNGLTEHELDHIFFGISDQAPVPDATEVSDYKYISPRELAKDLIAHPDNYTEWLKICFSELIEKVKI
jgi:isopentenyl-diphosphate delta-isomerase